MITTKRYDYVPFESIQVHPSIQNHRKLTESKVKHYATDIQRNGLLEPLIVWERNHYEFYLVGGFHRSAAIRSIREANQDFFDRVDVRVVSGSLDEMRALNLKLNADHLDAKFTDYFDSVIYLNNANWTKEQIAEFLDKSVNVIEEILRFVPSMDPRLRTMLEKNEISWNKCKAICRAVLNAAPGEENDVLNAALDALKSVEANKPVKRPITMNKAVKKLTASAESKPKKRYSVTNNDLLALLTVIKGKSYDDSHLERVRTAFPGLLDG